ncbi:MAG: DUF937 domain-containing protein [Bacteroidia bacterium]|nr:DUF937 domain-containing protein [Bacteroidia bacterium]HQV01188.1 DUF937 domain-containing protein [Bacteroidia bacterium]
MLDNLINLVKEHAAEAIVNNPAIDNSKNDAAISETANSIFESLKGQAASGNLQDVLNMFQGGTSNNALSSVIESNAIQTLASKFGIDATQAGQMVQTMLPGILNSLVNKTNDANDNSFDLQDIVTKIGGNSGGIGGMIGKLFGN